MDIDKFKESLELLKKEVPTTFYHGTDARTLAMSAEERDSFKKYCKEVAKGLRPYFPESCKLDLFKDHLDKDLYLNLGNALDVIDADANGNFSYQHDDFYLTITYEKARNYAYRSSAFGEIGLVAYRLIDAARKMGLKNIGPYSINDYYKRIISFAESEPRPIVLTFKGLDISLMETENGKAYDDCFRYKGNINVNDAEIEALYHQ